MALDTSKEALGKQIDALSTDFAAYSMQVLNRNRAYLRSFSPPFNEKLGEHDQWPDRPKAEDVGHTRSSFQLTRPTVELWAALEASEFPAIRWIDAFVPSPVPSLDDTENAQRQQVFAAERLVAQHISTLREELVRRQIRSAQMKVHHFRATKKKNLYGHSWLKLIPDLDRHRFRAITKIDPSTVYPVWSGWDDRKLDAVLVCYRKSARSLARVFPDAVKLDDTGSTAISQGYYQPTAQVANDMDLRYVWIEDYWVLDETYSAPVLDGEPVESLVVNALRINGKIVQTVEYPGWRAIPYFSYENEDERDHLGFSDAGTVQPIQDGVNRFLSQQADVIDGEANPKYKYRGDSTRTIELKKGQVISLDPDEDIEQLATRLDVFPTQVHGTQLLELLARSTGLNDSVWGRIVASQNSGRALATAWRSVAARMVPRLNSATETVTAEITFMVDIMELNDWDGAKALYDGNRDFEPDFPNQEPRDFLEVATHAINLHNAGAIDQIKMMELTGEESPDEMAERVKAEYMDAILHPEKAQAQKLLKRLDLQMQIEVIQLQAQLSQMNAPRPGGGTPEQQAGAATQAQTQAQQQAAPQLTQGQNAPATQPGAPGNATGTQFSTMVQNGGPAQNRIIDKGTVG